MNAYEAGAQALGLQLRYWRLQGPDDIDKPFTAIVGERFGALDVAYVVPTWTHRRKIADLALRHRLPAVYWHRTYAVDGGLISYGEDEREVPRRLALYVDKILRGAKPADLPIEQPTKLELVINLKTAKAIGVMIPQSLIGRADEVIRDYSKGCPNASRWAMAAVVCGSSVSPDHLQDSRRAGWPARRSAGGIPSAR
jgi:putative ABC transport system substrate-binding protein